MSHVVTRLRMSRARRTQDGAVAVLVAVSMVALCVAAAMVIDLGLIRVDRQVDKSAEDAAAMAGANGLVPDLYDPSLHPFAGVCQALNYLKAQGGTFSSFSSEQWSNGLGTPLGGAGFGCTSAMAAATCTPNAPATWARFTGLTSDGRSVVNIQSGYTVTGGNISAVTGGDFDEEALPAFSADPGVAARGGCDQLAVIVGEARQTTLGAVATSATGTRVRSVARVKIDPPESPYALLILERQDCQVLTNGNNGVAAINVDGYKSHPGMIHADSDGSGASCNKPLIVGQKADGVVAREAPDPPNSPGVISTVATSNQSDGLTNVYAGPLTSKSGPVTANQVSRKVLDIPYLGGITAARDTSAFAWVAAAGAGTVPDASWTKINSCPSGTVSGTKLLVKCNNMNNTASFPDATDIIFTGSLGGGSSSIKMPKARNVYVVGSSQPNGVGVDDGNLLSMHDNNADCGASIDGQRARLVIYGGSLTAQGGTFRACNTTVFLMGNYDDACLPTSPGSYYPSGNVCAGFSKPGNGIVNLGGNATVDWTAPSLVDDEIQAAPSDHAALEDLALWTETYGQQGLGGSGTVHLAGVFAAPNAKPLKLNGNPTWQVLNSQYVVRTLENDGGAVFNMRPSPTLPVAPPYVSFDLVR